MSLFLRVISQLLLLLLCFWSHPWEFAWHRFDSQNLISWPNRGESLSPWIFNVSSGSEFPVFHFSQQRKSAHASKDLLHWGKIPLGRLVSSLLDWMLSQNCFGGNLSTSYNKYRRKIILSGKQCVFRPQSSYRLSWQVASVPYIIFHSVVLKDHKACKPVKLPM